MHYAVHIVMNILKYIRNYIISKNRIQKFYSFLSPSSKGYVSKYTHLGKHWIIAKNNYQGNHLKRIIERIFRSCLKPICMTHASRRSLILLAKAMTATCRAWVTLMPTQRPEQPPKSLRMRKGPYEGKTWRVTSTSGFRATKIDDKPPPLTLR